MAVELAPRASGLLPLPLLAAGLVLWAVLLVVAAWPWRRRLPGVAEEVGALGALWLGHLLFFWRPLFTTDSVPRGGGDLASFFFPLHAFAAEHLKRGELPLWNPNLHAGMPQLANYQAAMLYPPNVVAWLVARPLSYGTLESLALLHYLIASIGAYALARSLGLTRVPSVGAGLIFAYSGFLAAHLGHYSMLSVAAWLPLLLLTTRLVALRRSWLWAGATALVTGLAATGGHQQTLLYALTLTGVWWLFWTAARLGIWDCRDNAAVWRGRGRVALSRALIAPLALDAARFVAGIGIGLGLAAPMLLPSLQLGRLSVRSALSFEQSTAFSLQPVALLHMVLPKVFGSNPTDYWGPFSNGEIWGYAGVGTLVLAGLALAVRREPVRLLLAGIGLVALLYALGPATPLQGWAYRFAPFYDLIRAPARGLLFVDLSLALLAGFAMRDLSDGIARNPRLLAALRVSLRGLLVALAALLLFVLPLFYSLILGVNDPSNRPVIAVDGLNLLVLYLAGTALLLWAVSRGSLPGSLAAVAAVVLIVIDLFGATATFNPTEEDLTTGFRHAEAVAFLRERMAEDGSFRIESATLAWQPDLAALAGLHDAGGLFDPMQLADYHRALDAALADRSLPLYDLLNIRYLIIDAQEPASTPGPGFEAVLRTPDGLALWENREALPRAWLTYRARVLDKAAAFAAITRPDFDPRAEVVLDRELGLVTGDGGSGAASVVAYAPDEVRVRVESDQPVFLVLADVNYPGWVATIDGQTTEVATADGVFRAVAVPRGTHEVTFRFDPPLVGAGYVVSAVSLAALLAVFGAGVFTRRRRFRASTPVKAEQR